VRHGRTSLRMAALVGAAALLSAETCEDNLGDNEPRPVTFRLSVGPQNFQANSTSEHPWLSSDGRFVAFASFANNLTLNPSAFKEIFVRDRELDQVHNVSLLSEVPDQTLINHCDRPSMSANGRYVAFESTGLLSGDPTGHDPAITNIYIRDRQTRAIKRVLETPWPTADFNQPSVTANGRYIAFQTIQQFAGFTYPGISLQVYVADMAPAIPTLTLVSRSMSGPATACNNHAGDPMISSDGQHVVFSSLATDLNPDSGPPAVQEIFRATLDLTGGTPVVTGTQLVSRLSGLGARADGLCARPTVSRDGRFVAFTSQAANLGGTDPSAYLTDMVSNTTTLVAQDVFLVQFPIFPGVFISIAERQGISDDGRFVTYTTTVNTPPTQVFLRDMQGGRSMVSVNPVGGPGNSFSGGSMISGDGRWIVFGSDSDNLVVGDGNGVPDVFGHGPLR